MQQDEGKVEELHLEVYGNRSILIEGDGSHVIFLEGQSSKLAQERLNRIKEALRNGFLENRILEIRDGKTPLLDNDTFRQLAEDLVNSLTSEVGRALIGLTILQCCIKSIEPEQSIRLHKASRNGTGFSWTEGISMRSIDREMITPILRKHDLLRLNADGFMMTRSLAENYPYTKVYKAALRGAKEEWLRIVDAIESGEMNASVTLDFILALLVNKSHEFQIEARQTLRVVDEFIALSKDFDDIVEVISSFVGDRDVSYSARIFEVAMHSLMQVLAERDGFEGFLKPLTQMRSANKKHGNIGDIEILEAPNSLLINEAWDAKFGKPHLRDELEELSEKLVMHPETRTVGFVVDSAPDLRQDIQARAADIEQLFNVKIFILSFPEWVNLMSERVGADCGTLGSEWLKAFAESLCQKRRDIAPIDEPSLGWVKQLGAYLANRS